MSGSRKNGRNGRNGRSAGKRMAKGSALMFSALGWHMPIFVSEGSRVWRLRNWYGLSKGEADSNEFTWGYEGDIARLIEPSDSGQRRKPAEKKDHTSL